MSGQGVRGAQAYRESYQYIANGNPGLSSWQTRRLALFYLRITASPPLGLKDRLAAWRQALEGVQPT